MSFEVEYFFKTYLAKRLLIFLRDFWKLLLWNTSGDKKLLVVVTTNKQ